MVKGREQKRRKRKPILADIYTEVIVDIIEKAGHSTAFVQYTHTGFVLVCCITFQHCLGGSWLVS